MMTLNEYCNLQIGKPWQNRATGPSFFDCWGLVIDSFRKVEGVELPEVKGYALESATASDAFDSDYVKNFSPSQPCDGAIMGAFDTLGNFVHVGRCVNGGVMHACEGMGVRWNSYAYFNKKFHSIVYVQYKG